MALDVAKQIAYWRLGAEDALGAAELLIVGGRYHFGLFFLHLALEKILKAIVVQQTGDVPPKSHDLLLLAHRAGLNPPAQILLVFGEFQEYCMAGRYPSLRGPAADDTLANRERLRAWETYTWLQQQLKK